MSLRSPRLDRGARQRHLRRHSSSLSCPHFLRSPIRIRRFRDSNSSLQRMSVHCTAVPTSISLPTAK